jgi:hypothetical protein
LTIIINQSWTCLIYSIMNDHHQSSESA